MKKTFITTLLISSALLNAKIELLDRIAIIVDDGVVMESQINKAMAALEAVSYTHLTLPTMS